MVIANDSVIDVEMPTFEAGSACTPPALTFLPSYFTYTTCHQQITCCHQPHHHRNACIQCFGLVSCIVTGHVANSLLS